MRSGLLVVELALEPWGAPHAALLNQLPAEEQRRIERCRHDADRYRSLAAALLPRLVIAHQIKQTLARIRFERSQSGKPFYPSDPGFHFNLSHSGSIVALAVGATPVGVDVEQTRISRDSEAIAKRFFTADEQHWLASFNDAERERRFVALWSRKESLLKASGEGVAGGLNSFSAIPREDSELAVDYRGRLWFLRSYPTLPGYALALCSGSPGFPLPIRAQVRAAQFIDELKPAVAALVSEKAEMLD
jgi:4'-phosphopantetheinyl transferase